MKHDTVDVAVVTGIRYSKLNQFKSTPEIKREKFNKCCICGGPIERKYTPDGEMYWDLGENAEPVKVGRCCGACNMMEVIPARLAGFVNHNSQKEKSNE